MEILIILLLIAINGFFALSEIAFVSSERELIESEKARGSRSAVWLLRMMDEPDKFLSSIQVGITLIGVVSGVYGGVAIADDLSRFLSGIGLSQEIAFDLSLFLVIGIITYLTIVLGELVPKTIGLKSPEKVVLAVTPIVRIFAILTHPAVSFLSWSTKAILWIVRIKPPNIGSNEDPLRTILGIAKAAAVKNKISREQEGIIANTARLESTKLSQIMVAREDMKCLTTTMSLGDALVESHVHHHTRFPLVDAASEEIIGYVNFKDIVDALRLNPQNPSLLGISRPVVSFTETDTISLVLRRLIATHQHIALVRTATGQVSGMITMEDILETIVGEIEDEYDAIPTHFYEISSQRFIAGGGVPMRRLRSKLGSAIPEEGKTLDQWIQNRLGGSVKVDSKVEENGILFIVRKLRRAYISEVIIEVQKK